MKIDPGFGTAWLACASVLLAGTAAGQVTSRVSVSSAGVQGNGVSFGASISGNGRFVAFWSDASNLVVNDTNGVTDVFVRDRLLNTTERVSVGLNGAQGNLGSAAPMISEDGRYVAFMSYASTLVPGDDNGVVDVFVRDRLSGTTTRASVDSTGVEGDENSYYPSISADGHHVAFYSYSTNLVPGDTNGTWDVFVHDLQTGVTVRASVDSNGAQANATSGDPSISGDGRYVVFASAASNLVPGDANGTHDVFVRDLQTGVTTLASVDSNGVQANSLSGDPRISADGQHVTFVSYATNLVNWGWNGFFHVYLHDMQSGVTSLASTDPTGLQANANSGGPELSADGRFAAFMSYGNNLVAGDTNGCTDVFLRDNQTDAVFRVSINSSGAQGNQRSGTNINGSTSLSVSSDGRFVAFGSDATNLVAGDTNATTDVFVHDGAASAFTSLCEPGVGGVIVCPCANPPSGAGRGCDNSSATGGAALSASGIAYLSMDSLVFTTSGQGPGALSIVMQGNQAIPNGLVYGQGGRCLGGNVIRRLYIKHAIGGSITAPEFGAGDLSVSARSASQGDVIHAGESRWYLVYYRDPNVLGNCPASSTFNATQTGRVDWSQ